MTLLHLKFKESDIEKSRKVEKIAIWRDGDTNHILSTCNVPKKNLKRE